jgi:peptidoglycan lytic transglycosylase
VLLVAHLLDRAGDHRNAHNLLRTRARAALRRPPVGENLRAWRIAYPPAFREEVRRWAPGANVPVDLVEALMREESGLDPRAVSPAGAIGLTQLMVPTAQELARRLRLGRIGRADLAGASLNIRLGARYLGDLIRRFDGSVALALAAYNAGGGAVSRWLDQRKGLEVDEFVEDIPIEETRGYVKRVLRSYAAYRLLYGSPGESAGVGLLGPARKS